MAIFLNTEVTVGNTLSSNAGAPFVSPTAPTSATVCVLASLSSASLAGNTRFIFNNTNNPLTTAVPFSATFVNTRGVTLSSGAGLVTYNRALSGQSAAIILSDRTAFTFTLPNASATVTLTAGLRDVMGPNEARLRLLGYF
jgi:hypothetical protein